MASLAGAMPTMLRNAGWWEGAYRVIERDGTTSDEHRMTTYCEFPDDGPFAYVQHNRLRWPDGRTLERSFGATFRDGRLWWDTDRLKGSGWEIEGGIVMLNLLHKSEPGLRFTEMIELGEDGQSRARTWQWFQHGVPVRRTLCDEWRIDEPRQGVRALG